MSFRANNRLHVDMSDLEISGLRWLERCHIRRAEEGMPEQQHERLCEIWILARGSQKLHVGDKELRLKGYQALVIPPQTRFSTAPFAQSISIRYRLALDIADTKPLCGGVDKAEMDDAVTSLVNGKLEVFNVGAEMVKILDSMMGDYVGHVDYLSLNTQSRLIFFLLRLLNYKHNFPGKELSREIIKSVNHIHEHILEEYKLEVLAKISGYSLNRFKSTFRQQMGVPPREYILSKKIEVAREFLRDTEDSITDIAFNLGFSTSQYFATVFRRIMGITPLAYRLSQQKVN